MTFNDSNLAPAPFERLLSGDGPPNAQGTVDLHWSYSVATGQGIKTKSETANTTVKTTFSCSRKVKNRLMEIPSPQAASKPMIELDKRPEVCYFATKHDLIRI